MRILLDEDVPMQITEVLRHLLRGHFVTHLIEMGWAGKTDLAVFHDITGKFDALVTNNYHQFNDPDETTAIKRSGVHHISYEQKVPGLAGLGLAVAAVVAAMPALIDDIADAPQRLITITAISRDRRYTVIDPRRDPPRYWPR